MERVAFLIESTGDRLSAMLNPSSVRIRRSSGLRVLDDRPGTLTGHGSDDDVLLATGGGRTEIELDLVFDVALIERGRRPDDVRSLTAPIWALSENREDGGGPRQLRLVWGKGWNVPAVVEAVSERFEQFSSTGAPRRSWMRLRLLRVAETAAPPPRVEVAPLPVTPTTPRAPRPQLPGVRHVEVLGAGGDARDGERLDDIAARELGSPSYWRHLAILNDIDDPPWVAAGRVLIVPPVALLGALSDPAGPAQAAS